MTTNPAGRRVLAALCLLLNFACADLKGSLLGTAPRPPGEGSTVVEGRVSAAIDEATLPSSFTYTAASGAKTEIMTVHATGEGVFELLSHPLKPGACKVTLALTPAEVATLRFFFAHEQICRFIPDPAASPIMCAHFVAEGHDYRVRDEGRTVRIGGCTVEGYQYLCDSQAAYGASEYLRTVVLPEKTPAECVPLPPAGS